MSVIHWLEEHMQACPSKAFLGIECPGCGIQRAFIELLRGNVIESFKLYPALIPIIITFGILALHLAFKYRNGASYVKWSFIFSVSIIVISFTIKMIVKP